MTNKEKFKEVFGFDGEFDGCCLAPCPPNTCCDECKYNDWWRKEYNPAHPDQDKENEIKRLKSEIDRLHDDIHDLSDKHFNDCLEVIKLKGIITEMTIKMFGGDT